MLETSRRRFLKTTAISVAAISLSAGTAVTEESSNRFGKFKKKVLMPIGDATETLDTFYPYFRIPEAGYELVVCGPEARKYHTVFHEIPPDSAITWDITQERPSYCIQATAAFRDIDPAEFCSVFLSGGRAPEYLRYDKDLIRILRHFHETQKPVASVCHGIELLTAANMIRGKRVTTVPKCQMDAEQGGAIYVTDPMVQDGNIITCKGFAEYPLLFPPYLKMLDKITQ
jgi:protease I